MAGVSAESVLEKISQEHLECPICFTRFTNPKILSCLHNFCQHCLEAIMEAHPDKGIITCPVCRKETDISKTGIAGISNNFSLMALVDEITQQEELIKTQQLKIFCDLCIQDKEAVVRCLNCREYLCQECHNAHKRMRKTTSHDMATIEDLQSGKAPFKSRLWNEVPKCEKHTNQDLLFFCETCLILICVACTAVDHRAPDHTVLDNSAAITSCKQKVNELVKEVEQHLTVSKAAAELADKSYTEHNNMIKNKHDIITQKADEEVSKIRENERLLKDKVTQFCHEKGKQFKKMLALHGENVEKTENTLERVNDVTARVCDFELLKLQQNLLQNLQDVKKTVIPSPVAGLTFHHFEKCENFSDADICELFLS